MTFPYEYNEMPRNSPFPEPRDTRTVQIAGLIEDARRLCSELMDDDPPDGWEYRLLLAHRHLVAALVQVQACK